MWEYNPISKHRRFLPLPHVDLLLPLIKPQAEGLLSSQRPSLDTNKASFRQLTAPPSLEGSAKPAAADAHAPRCEMLVSARL